MSEKKIESIMRGFVEAYVSGDVEKTLSFLAEDAVWVAPEGTFKGKEEVRRLLNWHTQTKDKKIRDAGVGIIVKRNKAVWEYVTEGTIEGMRFEIPGVCVYEFSNDKIRQHRAFYDRLSIGKQVVKGWFAKRVMSSILSRAEKGLH